jgi:DNA-directed RNA polymerase specialized sigma24 family protein
MEAEVVLIGRAADGPSDDVTTAVTDLYQGHALGLLRLALMMVGDRPTAEDVVQDAFLGLYRRWSHLRDRERALTYVRSAVLNGCRNALRRRRVPFLVSFRVVLRDPDDYRSVMEAFLAGPAWIRSSMRTRGPLHRGDTRRAVCDSHR